mmetsp:Transcript_17425/g.31613  ORF Transcript_17425/g.31613 Transcript_17425/m.31613 type:complete len:91 (+) Transcript_17425:771-1043(+)
MIMWGIPFLGRPFVGFHCQLPRMNMSSTIQRIWDAMDPNFRFSTLFLAGLNIIASIKENRKGSRFRELKAIVACGTCIVRHANNNMMRNY